MMDSTPVKKTFGEIGQITSPIIASPSSPLASLNARSARDLAIKFNKLIEDWKQLSGRSTVVVRTLAQTKLKCIEEKEPYSAEIDTPFNSIMEAGQGFCDIMSSMHIILKQFEALSKLCLPSELLLITWSASHLLQVIHKIISAYEKELEAKKCVIENIAHARESSHLAMHVAVWEYEVYLRDITVDLISLNYEIGMIKSVK